jgi:hypothetical protein
MPIDPPSRRSSTGSYPERPYIVGARFLAARNASSRSGKAAAILLPDMSSGIAHNRFSSRFTPRPFPSGGCSYICSLFSGTFLRDATIPHFGHFHREAIRVQGMMLIVV